MSTTRLLAAVILATISGSAAFVLPFSAQDQQRLLAKANEDTDFDAPVLNNPVMRADIPTALDHEIVVVDDECYLGKYGQYADCVDFDPMHESTQAKAAFEMPDFSAIGDEISAAFGKLFSFTNVRET